ncbi:hypothetical protein EJB05_39705, partial [Eragrostis curvula]
MPLPPSVARRCVARFRLPPDLGRSCPPRPFTPRPGAAEPVARGCERSVADTDAPGVAARRVVISGDGASADGGRRRARRGALDPSFPPTDTRTYRVVPPLLPYKGFSSRGGFHIGGRASDEKGQDSGARPSVLSTPHDVATEARRCLARFRLPAGYIKRSCPPRPDATEPAARDCQPSVVDAAAVPRRGAARHRVDIADDHARANGGRPARTALVPSRSSPPRHGSGAASIGSSSDEETQGDDEVDLFSGQSERAVYQEYLQSIGREPNEQDLPEGVLTVTLLKYQGLGKTIAVIALVLKEIDKQRKFMSTDSDIVVPNDLKDKPEKTGLSALFRQNTARCTGKPCIVERTPSSPSALRTRAKPAGGTLVVCPSSILMQWDEEIHNKVAKDSGLSVFTYHGCSRNIDPEELAKHDVVLTSYGMVTKQFSSRKKGTAKKPSDADDLNCGPVARVKWFRIVLDEAHVIRNRTSQVAGACWKLEAKVRWCITGTPMQNRIDDLYSCLRFLNYEPYSKYSSFHSLLKKDNKLEIFLGIILLRRTKETLIDGEPIIKLLPKTIQTSKLVFTAAEHKFYSTLDKNCRQIWMAYDATTKPRRRFGGKDYNEILSLLKKLQQACNHPCLVKKQDHHQHCSIIFERSYVSSKVKATIDILNSIVNKDAITETGGTTDSSEPAPEKVLVFSQFTTMLDLLEPLISSSHMQFRRFDGTMGLKARDKAVKDFSMNPKVTVLLVSLMAGSVGLNLTAASHVIIIDPWWNPSVEDQAIGRAHRIGQTRPVTVYRLAVQGTIEERVLYLQEKKRRMVERAFGRDMFGDDAKLTEEDLRYLFNV